MQAPAADSSQPGVRAVYHEVQDSGFCGVHCVNNLLQGAYYTEIDFAQMAIDLDLKEKKLMEASGVDSHHFLKYMAQDSERIDKGGNFSIEVLRKALNIMSLQCENIQSSKFKSLGVDVVDREAFVCNLQSHWFAIRKFEVNGEAHWIKLNSLAKGPEAISAFYLSAYLDLLKNEGYSIFDIGGKFPASMDMEGRGKWFEAAVLFSRSSSARAAEEKTAIDDDEGMQLALQRSMEGGDTATAIQGDTTAVEELLSADEEEELQRAILLSTALSQGQEM